MKVLIAVDVPVFDSLNNTEACIYFLLRKFPTEEKRHRAFGIISTEEE